MIDAVRIESDEGGWHLILDGDLTRECMEYVYSHEGALNLRLPQDAAAQLVAQTRPVAEWLAEGEAVRQERDALLATHTAACVRSYPTYGCTCDEPNPEED